MSLILEQVHTEGIAQLSYLAGDSRSGTAAVIDPRPDCEVYLDLARRHGIAIQRIFETHIHADFLSGSRELSQRLGGIPISVSHAGGTEYGFETERIEDGQAFEFGKVVLTAHHTPGHTPEHISLLVAEAGRAEPFGVLSGDTLFVDSVGRPDLLDDESTERLARQLFQSLASFYLKLNDGVILHPAHGAGSACGPGIGDRKSSTIGYEKRFNPSVADRLHGFWGLSGRRHGGVGGTWFPLSGVAADERPRAEEERRPYPGIGCALAW